MTVRVKPGSRRGPLVETGAANAGLVRALAEHFGVAPSRVAVVRGHASRTERVEVDL